MILYIFIDIIAINVNSGNIISIKKKKCCFRKGGLYLYDGCICSLKKYNSTGIDRNHVMFIRGITAYIHNWYSIRLNTIPNIL